MNEESMKYIFYLVLFFLLYPSGIILGNKAHNRLYCDLLSNKTYQGDPSDTIIETRLYKITDTMIKQLIDSSLVVDPYRYLVLQPSTNKIYSDYIELDYKPITIKNIGNIIGLYIDSISGKSLIIMALNDTILKTHGFSDTGEKIGIKVSNLLKTNIKINCLGISNYIKHDSDSTSNMNISLGFNGQTIFKYPEIAKKFSFIGEYMVNEQIHKNKETDKLLKNIIRRIRKRQSENSGPTVVSFRDTISQPFSFGSTTIERDVNKFITLPIYTFDSSFIGDLMARICDSLSVNDSYKRHYIYSKTVENKDEIAISGEFLLPESDIYDATGIIICNNGQHPFLLYNVSPNLLKKFGIINTRESIIGRFYIYKYIPMADDTPTGYYLNLSIESDGILDIAIAFANRRLFEEEARPFQWIIEDYINEHNIEFQNNERARGL